MKDSLPQYVTASAALAKASHYRGELPITQFPRLVEALPAPGTTLEVDLRLGRDTGHAGWLKGTIRGALPLICQRCLKTFSWPMHAQIELRLVTSEAEEARLINDFEPLLIEDDRLPLRQIVEDEALLAMPLAPHCDDPDCVVVFDADSAVQKS